MWIEFVWQIYESTNPLFPEYNSKHETVGQTLSYDMHVEMLFYKLAQKVHITKFWTITKVIK